VLVSVKAEVMNFMVASAHRAAQLTSKVPSRTESSNMAESNRREPFTTICGDFSGD